MENRFPSVLISTSKGLPLNLEPEFPQPLIPLFMSTTTHAGKKVRYRVAWGGRGSAKSYTFARMAIIRAMEEKMVILCCREIQNTIKDSVIKLLVSQIEEMGLQDHFDYGVNYLRCTLTGTEFIFKGLRTNAKEIKSTHGIKICWIEEAQGVSASSWEILGPTIRTPGSEIWVSFNPDEETDPTFVKFVKNPPPNAIVVKINYDENPWFPEELEEDRLHMQRTDIDAYAHIWLGECRKRTAAQIFNGKCVVEDFEVEADFSGPYFGADWGFAEDPNVLIKSWIGPHVMYGLNCLYIEYESFGYRVDNHLIPELYDKVPGCRKYTIRADNSRPETISYISMKKFNIIAAEKWPGSVEDGISFLRSFDKIIIHRRCRKMQDEARLYSYKIDRLTSDILPDIVDKHNHGWDAVRYSLDTMIRERRTGFTDKAKQDNATAPKTTVAPGMEEKSW